MNYARKNNFAKTFTAGQIVRAVIRDVGEDCVHYSVPGTCSAVLSAKAFGDGADRERALAALKVGIAMSLKVKAWHPANRELVFEGIAEKQTSASSDRYPAKTTWKADAHRATTWKAEAYVAKTTKPQYKLLPKGSLFLVDGANYLGKFQPEQAASALAGLAAGLADEGFNCQFFLEHRAWTWYSHRQPTAIAEAEFKAQCEKLDVSVVHGDSDAAILQTLEAVDDSVGLTGDHFFDYVEVYPDLVGSERVRAFDVTKYGEQYLITINGIRKAIKIDASRKPVVEPTAAEETAVEAVAAEEVVAEPAEATAATVEPDDYEEFAEAAPEKVRHVKVFTEARTGGLYGRGSWLLEQGKIAAAVRCFKQVAETDARGFAGLADAYAVGGEGVERDARKSAKYWSMRERFLKVQRERSRRRRRLQIERRRSGLLARCA